MYSYFMLALANEFNHDGSMVLRAYSRLLIVESQESITHMKPE